MNLFKIFGTISVDDKGAMDTLSKVDKEASKVGGSLNKLSGGLKSTGELMTKTGSTMTKMFTLPLAAMGGVSVKIGAEFQQSMANVSAVSGATGADLEKLEKKAREMGATTRFSASQAAEALGFMGMAGWKTEQMMSGLPGVMNLAAASGEDLGLTSDILTDSITAFGDEASDAGRYADVLAAASANANTNVSMLGESFKYAAPVAGALRYTLEDTSKAIALMANSGIKASAGGTSLRSVLTNLSNPSKQAAIAMDKLNLSLTNTDGSMKTLDEVMVDLREGFSKLTEEQQAQYAASLAGKTGMSGLLAIVNASEEDFNKLGEAINNSNGKAKEMADIMDDTLQGRLQKMKSALEEVGIIIFDTLEPGLKLILDVVTKLAEGFQKLPGPIQKIIVVVGLLITVAGPLILLFGKIATSISALSSIGITLSSTLGGLSTAAASLASIITKVLAVVFSPAGALMIGIGLVIAAGVLLYKNWDKIKDAAASLRDFLGNVWGAIKDTTVKTFNAVKDAIVKPIEKAKEIVRKIVDQIKDFFSFKIKLPDIKLPKIFGDKGNKDNHDEPKPSPKPKKNRLFAKGGYMSNATEFARSKETRFIGGEAGKEGIVPLEGKHMKVLIAEAIAQLKVAGNNNPPIVNNINISGVTVREDEDIRKLAKAVSEELERLNINKNRLRGAY